MKTKANEQFEASNGTKNEFGSKLIEPISQMSANIDDFKPKQFSKEKHKKMKATIESIVIHQSPKGTKKFNHQDTELKLLPHKRLSIDDKEQVMKRFDNIYFHNINKFLIILIFQKFLA